MSHFEGPPPNKRTQLDPQKAPYTWVSRQTNRRPELAWCRQRPSGRRTPRSVFRRGDSPWSTSCCGLCMSDTCPTDPCIHGPYPKVLFAAIRSKPGMLLALRRVLSLGTATLFIQFRKQTKQNKRKPTGLERSPILTNTLPLSKKGSKSIQPLSRGA